MNTLCIAPSPRRRRGVAGLLSLAACLAFALAGCSTDKPWINQPLVVDRTAAEAVSVAARDPSALIAVTLSGGGARAAAFGLGVLQELRATPCCWQDRGSNLLDAVDVVSGVSGGSIMAAYFAAFGGAELPRFEEQFLRRNFQDSLLYQVLNPSNLVSLSSPWFGRSQLLMRRLDDLYRGMTFGDVERRPRHPQLVVTATDMSMGTGFEFTTDQFELICSDLYSVPLSFAVAASSAVPILLSPVTLKNYSGDCAARHHLAPKPLSLQPAGDYRTRMLRSQEGSYLDARTRPYIHLVDGGLSDNLGVRRLIDRALAGGGLRASFREVGIPPGSIRRMVLITVNSQRDPANNVDASGQVPGITEVVDALLFGTGARATTETQEFLADVTRQWERELRTRSGAGMDAFAADAELHVIQVNLRDAPDAAERRRLLQTPTAFSINDTEVTQLIDAGRHVLRQSHEFQALRRSLGLDAN